MSPCDSLLTAATSGNQQIFERNLGLHMKNVVLLLALTATGLCLYTAIARGTDASHVETLVTADGRVILPKDFRCNWVHLGSWAAPAEGAKEGGFHDVYTQLGTVEAYRKSGEFPDGACLVKEIRTLRSAKMSSGPAMWAGDIKKWFVMIKDSTGRFKDNPHWGEGWGWALFMENDPGKNVSTDFRKDCVSCHSPAKKTDWVYVFAYPTLREGKCR